MRQVYSSREIAYLRRVTGFAANALAERGGNIGECLDAAKAARQSDAQGASEARG